MATQYTIPLEQMQTQAVVVQNLLRTLNAMLCLPGSEDEQAQLTEMAMSHSALLRSALDRMNS